MTGHKGGRAGRVARWRARYWQRLEQVTSDLDRIGVAADHLRLVLAKCTTPEQRKDIVATAIADLAGPAEELLTRFEKRGKL
jgi:hypothetical protein